LRCHCFAFWIISCCARRCRRSRRFRSRSCARRMLSYTAGIVNVSSTSELPASLSVSLSPSLSLPPVPRVLASPSSLVLVV
jgi:hypothetical protein